MEWSTLSILLLFVLLVVGPLPSTCAVDDDFTKFVVASQRLLANGDVLAVAPYFAKVQSRQAVLKQKSNKISPLFVNPANISAVLLQPAPSSTFDWVVVASSDFFRMPKFVAVLKACRHWTHYGVLMWSNAAVDAANVARSTDFVYVDDYSGLIGHSARVFNLKQLIRSPPVLSFPFQASFLHLAVRWTDTATLGTVDFRVHTPVRLQQTLRGANIVLVVNSGADYGPQRDAIRHTWGDARRLAQLGIVLFFVVASPSRELMAEMDLHGDIMMFEANEGYNGTWSVLPLKGIGSRQVALKYATNAAWFFRCDDDTYVHPANLFAMLNRYAAAALTNSVYVGCAFDGTPYRTAEGHRKKWNVLYEVYKPHRYPRFMSGGAGYALSRRAAVCLSSATRGSDWRYFDREDVLVRLTLSEFCGRIVVNSHCELASPQFVTNPNQAMVSIHYARPEERVHALYEHFTNGSSIRSSSSSSQSQRKQRQRG